jgi:SAM-dependent methyltransferase
MKNGYRLGIIDRIDLWAIRYAFFFRDHERWIASPDRLKIAEYIDLSKKSDFLEIGPQTGWRTLSSLALSGQNTTAMDYWSFYPAWKILNKRVRFVLADANFSLPFRDLTFDNCVFMGAISYLAEPLAVLQEIYRILRKGGHLFLSCNKKNSYAANRGMLDPVMKTLWDEIDVINNMRAAGFEVVETYSWGYPSISIFDKWVRQVQKFMSVDGYSRKRIRTFAGEESFVCCIGKKT